MFKRYTGGLAVAVGVFALAVGPASAVTLTNPGTGQVIDQGNGTQTLTQPVPDGTQSIAQSPGSQTVTQPGQCIQQGPSGQGATQGSQTIAQPQSANCAPAPAPGPAPGPAAAVATTPAATTPGATTPTTGTTPTERTPSDKTGPGHSGPGGHGNPTLSGGPAGAKHLAFTGFDVWKLMLLGGMSLAGAGGLWRFTRRSSI